MTDDTRDLVATGSQTIGPFFHFALAMQPVLGGVEATDTTPPRTMLRVSVRDGDGGPVPDALIELWQGRGASAIARQMTDESGVCEFAIAAPGGYVNVCLFARGLLRHLHTRAYFGETSAPADDPVLRLVPEARRRTLIARQDAGVAHRWAFDIRLQGDDETVFFAV